MEYWQEGSTSTAEPPTSTTDFMVQHNRRGGITVGTALVAFVKSVTHLDRFFNHLNFADENISLLVRLWRANPGLLRPMAWKLQAHLSRHSLF